MLVRSYRDLQVWKKGMELVEAVYVVTQRFPGSELYGLTTQMRRAAISVPSNIAEGHSRSSTKEFLRYLSIALGSLAELETQLMLGRNLGYVSAEQLDPLLKQSEELGKMIRGLQKSLNRRLSPLAPNP